MNLFGMKDKKKEESLIPASIREERKYIIWSNDDFFLRESYKTMRSNVVFSLAGREGCSVIAVTSAQQGEGKSITCVNLAMSFADTGARVLLIDCDLRKPKMGRLLSLTTDLGLTDVLVRKAQFADAAVHLAENRPLWVLSAGRIPPNPSEILGSPAMRMLVEKLRERFDYIILDTPPVELVTDAMVLSQTADGFLFVVRANQSDGRAVRHSLSQLTYAGARVLGTVLNGISEFGGMGYRKYGYGRYAYRRIGYGYGYGGKHTGDGGTAS